MAIMSSHLRCNRGFLAKWAADPGVPYRHDPSTGTYLFRLSDTAFVADAYCHFCGGHPTPSGVPRCTCRFLENCHKHGLPVELENMFMLKCKYQGREG